MTAELKASRAATRQSTHKADICLLVEGCYPYVSGGVSSWIDWLMRTQPERSFAAVAIVADCQARNLRYQFPDNLTHFSELVLQSPRRPKRIIMSLGGSADDQELAGLLTALIRGGGLAEFARVSEIINRAGRCLSLQDLLETLA